MARGKNRFITCAPFDCFWKVRAALAITVVVQLLKINGGVRSFFLLKKAMNTGVQEKTNQRISFVMLYLFRKLMFLNDKLSLCTCRFFGQATHHTRIQLILYIALSSYDVLKPAVSAFTITAVAACIATRRQSVHVPVEDPQTMSSPSRVPTYVMQQRSELTDFYIRDKKGRHAETSPHRHEYFLSLIHI